MNIGIPQSPTNYDSCVTWVLTERIKPRLKATEIKNLRIVNKEMLINKIQSSQVRKQLQITKLAAFIEKKAAQLIWIFK